MAVTTGLAPESEKERLAALARYDIVDTPPEEAFDRISALVARLLAVPIAMVSFVDSDRVWLKSVYGVDVRDIPRSDSMCSAVITRVEPYLVADLAADPLWSNSALVKGELGARFYAGVPLTTPEGHNVGALCVIDVEPRQATAEELATLTDLASITVHQLELRLLALGESPQPVESPERNGVEEPVAWEDPPERKVKASEEWAPLLQHVAQRTGHWAKLRHYDGETSAYRAAAQLRKRDDLPPGHWEFLARRDSDGGSNLFARVSGSKPGGRGSPTS
ncbi:MAG: GAF domain-containing protein [Actinobacteria bacterium]|nr:GAF domain-containing protein [Actinomycetota bacterium]